MSGVRKVEITRIDEAIPGAYGMVTADMNGDGRRDVVVGSTGVPMIAWYEAPSFARHVVSTQHTGTICLAAHDLRGTGLPDLIAGSGFNRRDRSLIEYLHWLERPASGDGEWTSHYIEEVPFIHRATMLDVHGTGDPVLVVASLRGPDGGLDEWHDPGGVWIYTIPDDPYGPWAKVAIDDRLHLNHGMAVCDVDDDGRPDLLIGAREGLLWYEPGADVLEPWTRWVISDRESSECWAADLDGDGLNELLSIEPWHGNELVIYRCEGDLRHGPWRREVIDDSLNRGHSVQAADVDGDGVLELVVGYNGEGTELLIYRQNGDGAWERETIDDRLGMGQMEVGDLDGDGKVEIAATGMSTGNVRWYDLS